MRDATFYQLDETVNADAVGGAAFKIDGTPVEGLRLGFQVERDGADADETLIISVYGKDGSDVDNGDELLATIPQIVVGDLNAAGEVYVECVIHTTLSHIIPYFDVGGTTPDWDIQYAVVSGPSNGVVG